MLPSTVDGYTDYLDAMLQHDGIDEGIVRSTLRELGFSERRIASIIGEGYSLSFADCSSSSLTSASSSERRRRVPAGEAAAAPHHAWIDEGNHHDFISSQGRSGAAGCGPMLHLVTSDVTPTKISSHAEHHDVRDMPEAPQRHSADNGAVSRRGSSTVAQYLHHLSELESLLQKPSTNASVDGRDDEQAPAAPRRSSHTSYSHMEEDGDAAVPRHYSSSTSSSDLWPPARGRERIEHVEGSAPADVEILQWCTMARDAKARHRGDDFVRPLPSRKGWVSGLGGIRSRSAAAVGTAVRSSINCEPVGAPPREVVRPPAQDTARAQPNCHSLRLAQATVTEVGRGPLRGGKLPTTLTHTYDRVRLAQYYRKCWESQERSSRRAQRRAVLETRCLHQDW